MAKITLKGNEIDTVASLPAVGSAAPGFILVTTDLSEVSLKDYLGKTVVLNIFPTFFYRGRDRYIANDWP